MAWKCLSYRIYKYFFFLVLHTLFNVTWNNRLLLSRIVHSLYWLSSILGMSWMNCVPLHLCDDLSLEGIIMLICHSAWVWFRGHYALPLGWCTMDLLAWRKNLCLSNLFWLSDRIFEVVFPQSVWLAVHTVSVKRYILYKTTICNCCNLIYIINFNI